MTAEQAKAYLDALPSDEVQGRETAKEFWENGSWANFFISGYDFAALFGRTWEEAFWRAIEGLKTLDPDKAAADLALAHEQIRREQLAEEEKRRRRAEERAAKKRSAQPVKRNPFLPVPKILPIVSSHRWMKRTHRF